MFYLQHLQELTFKDYLRIILKKCPRSNNPVRTQLVIRIHKKSIWFALINEMYLQLIYTELFIQTVLLYPLYTKHIHLFIDIYTQRITLINSFIHIVHINIIISIYIVTKH